MMISSSQQKSLYAQSSKDLHRSSMESQRTLVPVNLHFLIVKHPYHDRDTLSQPQQ